ILGFVGGPVRLRLTTLSVPRHRARPCEVAISEAQSCDRTAEAFGSRPLQIKAWLDWAAGQRRADSFALDPQGTERHRAIAHWSRTSRLDRSIYRTVGMDARHPSRAIKTRRIGVPHLRTFHLQSPAKRSSVPRLTQRHGAWLYLR